VSRSFLTVDHGHPPPMSWLIDTPPSRPDQFSAVNVVSRPAKCTS
jgi:hypothetical protein